MQIGNFLNDGQAQATTMAWRPGNPVEALENVLDVLFRNTRTAVLDA